MVEIWTEELPQDWRWSPCCYLGGTPESVINVAECCQDECVVYYDGEPTEKNGVFYAPRSAFQGTDIVLACNGVPPKLGKHSVFWTSFFHARDFQYQAFDERIVLSPYHQSIFGQDSRVVPLSVWPEQFSNPVKVPKQCLYSSSPDRGLDFLKSIWDEVEYKTGAKLISTYDKSISEQEMIELYKSSEFWLHPGLGVELFCIAAAKAQVAQCVPVVVPTMALATTVKYGVRSTLENYKRDLINAILNPPKIEPVNFGTWQTVTDDLLRNCK